MLICMACGGPRQTAEACAQCRAEVARIEGFEAYAPESAHTASGFDPQRFAFLSRVQHDNFWFRARNELITWALDHCFPEARSLLEIGCGSGAVLEHVARHCPRFGRLAGSDAHVEALRFAARRVPQAQLLQMDARRTPFREEFDVVACLDVIEHIDEDQQVLAAIHEAIVPGGGLVVTVPQHRRLWSRHDEVARHVRRYEAGELARRVEAAGFRTVLETSFVTLLLPLMFASRMMERFAHQPETEGLRVRDSLNHVLLGVMRVERAIIVRGGRFPVGGSRLLAARRL